MSYNLRDHLLIERWKLSRPRNRYLIRKYRRLRKLGKGTGIPVDLPDTGGEVVTAISQGKVSGIATYLGRQTAITEFD